MNITEHEGRRYFPGWAGLDLHFNSWCPPQSPKAVVVLVHGYAEHHARYTSIIERLVEDGFVVYAYDQRGHGRSEGIRGDVVRFKDLVYDLATIVELVKQDQPDFCVFILAHSMGASAAAVYVAEHPEIAGLITTGIYLHDAEGYDPKKKILAGILARFAPLVPIQYQDPVRIAVKPAEQAAFRDDPLVYHGNVRIRMGLHFLRMADYVRSSLGAITAPLFILHGGEDRLSAIENSRMLYSEASSEDKTLKIVDGCGHALLHDQEKSVVTDEIVDWIRKRL